MFTTPAATAVAKPLLLMVAMVVLLEVHVALLLMSWWVPSPKTAVAVYCCVVGPVSPLTEICALVGVIEIETSAELVTVSVAEPLTPAEVALMVAVPAVTPVANPVSLTVATPVLEDVHTRLLRLDVLPSSFVPDAVNCTVEPFTTDAVEGATVMLCSLGFTKNPRQLESTTARPTTMRMEAPAPIRAARFRTGFCKFGIANLLMN